MIQYVVLGNTYINMEQINTIVEERATQTGRINIRVNLINGDYVRGSVESIADWLQGN